MVVYTVDNIVVVISRVILGVRILHGCFKYGKWVDILKSNAPTMLNIDIVYTYHCSYKSR